MENEVIFPIWMKILLIVFGIVAIIYLIKEIRYHIKRRSEKNPDSYLPEFQNKDVEKYYYDAYTLVTTNFKAYDARRKTLKYKIIIFLALIPFGVCLLMYFETEYKILLYASIASILTSFILSFKIFMQPRVIYTNIIPAALKYVNKTLEYQESAGIHPSIYDKAFTDYVKNYNSYYSNDLITGMIKDCKMIMSEVHTQNVYKDDNDQTHADTIFHGVVLIVDLDSIRNTKEEYNINKIKIRRDFYIFEKKPGDEYEAKILDNKLYVRFFIGSTFTIDYSNPKKEALELAQNLYNIEYILENTENIINEIIEKKL